MNEGLLERIKEILKKTADEMGLTLVEARFIPNGENGPTLEVGIDKDYNITMDDIEAYTDKVNPLIDALGDDDPEGYVLDIASGGSLRHIPFEDLSKLVGQYLDVRLRSGETITMLLLDTDGEKASFQWFIKGRKKTAVLAKDDILDIHMGYKA